MYENSDLSGALFALSKEVIDSADLDMDNDNLWQKLSYSLMAERRNDPHNAYNRIKVLEYFFSENHVSNISDKFDHYQPAVNEVSSIVNNKDAEKLVNHYLGALLERAQDGIQDEQVVNMVSVFKSQLEDSPIPWNPEISLIGIDLNGEPIPLSDEVTLHHPNESEPSLDLSLSSDFDPTSVIKFSTRAATSAEVTKTINKYIITLQLYDVGSILKVKQDYNPKAILPINIPSNKPVIYGPEFTYTVSAQDNQDIQDFCDRIVGFVLKKLIEAKESTPLVIAHDRYESALEESKSKEMQITSAMMCLEALLLKEEERGELSERLSRRAGILLHHFDYQPNEVNRKIKRAYKIRSQYVHGSKVGQDATDLSYDIVDYARRSLLTFLQLEERGKDDLLAKIDNASLHPDAREELYRVLEEKCEF